MTLPPRTKLIIKIVISLALLGLLFHEVNAKQLIAILKKADVGYLILALCVQSISTLFAAIRWQWLMRILGFSQRFSWSYKVYYIATLFNQVLPTTIGGDSIRVMKACQLGQGKMAAFYAVLVDRAYGITGLLLLNLASLYALYQNFPAGLSHVITTVTVSGLSLILVLSLLHTARHYIPGKHRLRFFMTLSQKIRLTFQGHMLNKLLKLILAALPNFFTILALYCIARALHMNVSLGIMLAIIPAVILLTLIPISLAGWGIRESAMVGFFLLLHIPKTLTLCVSITYGIMLSLSSLPGLWAYLSKTDHKDKK